MTNKYKVSEFAKDFGMASKEITAIVKNLTGEEKKSGAALVELEIALLFDFITKEHTVKSFKEYFATGEASRAAAAQKRKAERDKKLADQMAILEQLKAAAEAAAKGEEPKEEKPAKKTAAKKAAKAEDTEAAKPAKPAKTVEKKTVKKAEPPKEEKPYDGPLVAPPKKEKNPSLAPNRGPAQLRHVDTRVSNVNIDKYNEKYETIAPANTMRDNYTRKQKIKQKSQDYRRPQGAKRETEADKLRRLQLERIKKTPITVTVGEEITVGELAAALKKTAAEVIKELMKLGMMASVNQVIDYDTAEIVVTEMGAKIQKAVVVTI